MVPNAEVYRSPMFVHVLFFLFLGLFKHSLYSFLYIMYTRSQSSGFITVQSLFCRCWLFCGRESLNDSGVQLVGRKEGLVPNRQL
jgi:hypothetical protein